MTAKVIAEAVFTVEVALVLAIEAVAANSRVTNTRLADAALDLLCGVIVTDECMASEFCRPGLGCRLRHAHSCQY